MPSQAIHRFEQGGRRFAIDPETCFCFECDAISWDVLEYYPHTTLTKIYRILGERYDVQELNEVIGELEWLRSTKSILPPRKREDMMKEFDLERGLKRLTVCLPRETEETIPQKRGWFGGKETRVISNEARQLAREAVELLLSRSGRQQQLHLEFRESGRLERPEFIADVCRTALKLARLAGKSLTAAVHIAGIELKGLPAPLAGHALGATLEFQDPSDVQDHLTALARCPGDSLPRLAKVLQPSGKGVTGRIVVQPKHPGFGGVVEVLDKADFKVIELDLDGAYVADPGLDPREMLTGLKESAEYYAQRLLKGRYFRLDPIAALFWRIYEGSPLRRSDPSGLNELAIDTDGAIYPCARWLGREEFLVGSVTSGAIDDGRLARFDDIGSVTTGPCRRCWARNLCGGGTAAVHHSLSGSFRRPHEPWCDAQRSWMAGAVSAFNLLSSEGVNFTRVYRSLTASGGRPSLFTMVRAAFTMSISMRPIQEADAEMLVRWENWNEAAYFVFTDNGVLMANQYNREMDALHPTGREIEMLIIRRNGTPIGLLKLRPLAMPGTAFGWIYLRNKDDYHSSDIRKGLRFLLKETANSGGFESARRLTIPAGPGEDGLRSLLEAVGATHIGTQREALYLHGAYHDVDLYTIALDRL